MPRAFPAASAETPASPPLSTLAGPGARARRPPAPQPRAPSPAS